MWLRTWMSRHIQLKPQGSGPAAKILLEGKGDLVDIVVSQNEGALI